MMTLVEKINGWHPVLLSLGALGFSFSDVEVGFRIATLAVTMGYSIWKWNREYRKKK